MTTQSVRVLFVCLGNICRSPMAEAVLRDMAAREGLEGRLAVDSAGTGSWHIGKPPHEGTRRVLDRCGVDYAGMRGRQIEADDFARFDYIVCMDGQNERDVRALRKPEDGRARVLRLLELVPESGLADVPDPYYTGDFEQTYELVAAGCKRLLERIGAEQEWPPRP